MKLLLKRVSKQSTYTIGKLYIDGVYYCDTLEDKDRGLKKTMSLSEIKKIKVMHETSIPTGTYNVIVNMSPSKKRLLPRLLNVPGYEGILIHRGNTDKDSSGCILVGENSVVGKVLNSTKYELELIQRMSKAESVTITIE